MFPLMINNTRFLALSMNYVYNLMLKLVRLHMALHYKFLTTSASSSVLVHFEAIHCENFIDVKTTLCNIDLISNTKVSTSEKITCPNCLEIIKRCKEIKRSELSSTAGRAKVPYECFKLNWELKRGRTKILDLTDYKAIVIVSEGLELVHKHTGKIVKIWFQSCIEDVIEKEHYHQTHYLNFYYFNDDSIYRYAKEAKVLIYAGENWKKILKEGRKK